MHIGIHTVFVFSVVSALTWCCGRWPRLFVRLFMPPDELTASRARGILRDPSWTTQLTMMALLQLAFGFLLSFILLAFGGGDYAYVRRADRS